MKCFVVEKLTSPSERWVHGVFSSLEKAKGHMAEQRAGGGYQDYDFSVAAFDTDNPDYSHEAEDHSEYKATFDLR